MNYKKVIEEQIAVLQQAQKDTVKNFQAEATCKIAETITGLCKEASCYN